MAEWIQMADGGVGDTLQSMLIASENMVADNTLYNSTYLKANGSTGATVAVMRPNGVVVKSGNVGFLGYDSALRPMFHDAHSWPQSPIGTTTVGVTTEGAEAANAATYNASTAGKGLVLNIMSRVAYFNAGDAVLYGYARSLTFDDKGHMFSVGAETRISIEVPTSCP